MAYVPQIYPVPTFINPSTSAIIPSTIQNNQPELSSIPFPASLTTPIKLTSTNYQTRYSPWRSIFIVVVLTHHITDQPTMYHLHNELWYRIDQLLRSALIASLSTKVVSLVNTAETSYDVWTTLCRMYANPSRAQILSLKDSLTHAT